jgi:electron transfer flavoprotein beta subunit
VVVVSVGPAAVQETLRKALGMGADRAIQLSADEVPFDGRAVATALAAELKDGGYDLVLFGRMATDSANQTVGPMTAHLMGVPCVTAISKLDIAAGRGTAERQLEGASRPSSFAAGRRPSTRGLAPASSSRGSWPPRRSRSRSSRRSSAPPA